MIHRSISKKLLAVAACAALIGLDSCKSTSTNPPPVVPSQAYTKTVLVADVAGFGASTIDTSYKNGWGISIGSSGIFWLSSNHGGVTNVYDGAGGIVSSVNSIKIPSRNGTGAGSPSGVVFNGTSSNDFNNDKFIYSTEDGVIAGWNGPMKLEATDPSPAAVYKGIALASTGGNNYLYVTDFGENKIVVYDKTFKPVTLAGSFTETGSPAIPIGTPGFGPFGIQNIGGLIYVTYAKHKPAPDDGDDAGGAGNGYVSVFNPDGTFVKRFASNGKLSSPWGITVAPSTFGEFKNAVLISNFGDGTISGFDLTGTFLGQISTDVSSTPMNIDGIWGIMFTGPAIPNGSNDQPNTLYFTAGPGGEAHGLFGYIK